jgi:hypothetical protein
MPALDNNHWHAVLVKNAPRASLHLFIGASERGIVFFSCEQAPLMAFQSHGLPSRCPVCSIQNPLIGKANADQG